ncbi:MAG: SBBP repeat-containing protein, partial [Bryobacterales bacterium]|nr:SBBP repeat-containing protein [Bryobacterales bacterium]
VPRNFPSASAFDPHHPGWIYLGISAGVAGTLFVSRDLGLTWTELTAPPDTFSAIDNLLIDPEIPNVIYALALRGLFISADGGRTWGESRDIRSKVRMAHLPRACSAAAGIFAATRAGTFWASSDSGTTWRITPLDSVVDVAAGPGCSVFVVNVVANSPDVYVSKTAPDGRLLWATYLGGLGVDTAVAAAVDAEGNLYVTGSTTSSNFPGMNRETGEDRGDIFVTKFGVDGRRLYSAVLGGSGYDSVAGLAVYARGQAYVAGASNSPDFPVTPGALRTPGDSGAVAIRLDAEGNVLYAAKFSEQLRPAAIALTSSGEALLTGPGFLVRLNESGSALTYEDYKSPWAAGTAIATDSEGNVYLAGSAVRREFTVTPEAYRSPVPVRPCGSWSTQYTRPHTDTFVAKLRSSDFAVEYAALLGGDCWSEPQAIRVAPDGSVTAAILTQSVSIPVVQALAMPLGCGTSGSGVIARLSPDGRTLDWATYLPSCRASYAAPAPNGALYVVLNGPGLTGGTVVHMPPPAGEVAVERVDVAFAFASFGIPPGALVGISGSNLGPAGGVDLGLNAASQLPVELGGTRVLFDGVEAPLLHVSSSRIVCVAPNHLTGQTVLQVISHAGRSDEVTVPVRASAPYLLTWAFPGAPPLVEPGDGIVRNEDGTLNGPSNPAVEGSTITVYVTGLGFGDPAAEPGSIAASPFVPSFHPLYYFWGRTATPVTDARALPGFVSALWELPVTVPTPPTPYPTGLQLRLGTTDTMPSDGALLTNLPEFSNPIVVWVRRR